MTLNPQQQLAVESNEPYILTIAGAGTGKTRTLTERIKRLLRDGINPQDITAITFTKKAAAEMRQRIGDAGVFVDTFHAWCLKLLREYGHLTGWNGKALQVIDEEDQKKIIDGIKKNLGITPSKKSRAVSDFQGGLVRDEYRAFCRDRDVIDYDMIQEEALLLLQSVCIPNNTYYLIDEFQDTDPVQYAIISQWKGNIFAVGDDAQAIYGFRGACVQNIQLFIRDFQPQVIKLEQNYRSGQVILDYANKIPVNAVKKELWSEIPEGDVIIRESGAGKTIQDEAETVIQDITGKFPCPYSHTDPMGCTDCMNTSYVQDAPLLGTTAILARTNFYLDEYATILTAKGIEFTRSKREGWTREEKATINTLKAISTSNSAWVYGYGVLTGEHGNTGLISFIVPEGTKLHDLYIQYLAVCEMLHESYTDQGFLDFIETQQEEAIEVKPGINLLTIHAAKGLEFDNVFIVGCADGIFPLNSEMYGEPYEEAKRLFYVAVTRAKTNLFISWPETVWMWGKEVQTPKSRLII